MPCYARTLLQPFIVFKEVNGVLIEILSGVVVSHDGLRVPVLAHHLHLPIGKPRVERPRNSRPAQVVW